MTDELWFADELAERWRCSKDVVRDMLRRGELRGFKIGTAKQDSWRIWLSDILAFEKAHANTDAPRTEDDEDDAPSMPEPIIRRIS